MPAFIITYVVNFLKAHWQKIVVLAALAVIVVMLKQQKTAAVADMQHLQQIHDTEIKTITDAQIQERKEHEKNLNDLQKQLADVQQKYDDAKKTLDTKTKANATKIVKETSGDPSELADMLSNATGIPVTR
jgi:Skp family chaperone for outer membrane proteins